MSSHKLPQPSDPLPSLTHAERTLIHKAARLVRKGRLDEVRLRRHEKKGSSCFSGRRMRKDGCAGSVRAGRRTR